MKIVFLGSGNVATNMSIAMQNAGHAVMQIYNHRIESAKLLAEELKCSYTDQLTDISVQAEVYVISVKDDVIEELAKQLSISGKVVVHTAGSVPMEALSAATTNFGVLYPLQTFTKGRLLDFKTIPLFVEAADERTLAIIKELANTISSSVKEADFEQRKILHLSAVLACNFVNHLYDLSQDLLKVYQLDFDALRPLVLETALKVQKMNPHEGQTGPARRNDQLVIAKHLQLLSNNVPLKNIYTILTDSIVKSYQ
ncbi:Rossmann-like and DUF2520 domain-containing protein [Solitalea canadensis]|uniref:DUF2520 domain-containing protein n=1 Tax=Solitalea canadensis (strain ATCC 29591 / DSM 3403 / JCM 21819 / LMG 8368 / NBRC 15130 / NCIMB 12057 / USAM 9D) TaxID=929556 RepID=H8KV11_SOLCM|nr:Rossmann-like and DUF2520 domain-containing protein [Solitalea canadensis]AFD06011.1 protein of unknown function (DUF2520) [Solitalea canadensis DSM 3403]